MHGWFFTNTIWYLLLFAVSALVFVAALEKSENRGFTVVFTLATVGLFYIFEYILVMTDAYAYSPKVFPNDPFLDTYMGNVVSQTSIAAISAFIISYRVKWYWIVAFAVAYYVIQMLFISLEIFSVHWYRPIFTFIILVPLLIFLQHWHEKAVHSGRKIDGILLHFLGVLAVASNMVSFPLRLSGLFVFSGEFFEDPSKDHTATAMIYNFIILGVLIAAWRSPRKRIWVPAAFIAMLGLHWAAWQAGLIESPQQWFGVIASVQIAAFYLWVCIIGHNVQARLGKK